MIRVLVVLALALPAAWAGCKTYCCDCPETCEGQADVSISVDLSGSSKDVIGDIVDFLNQVLNGLGVNNQHFWVCLSYFKKDATLVNSFSSPDARDLSALLDSVNNLPTPSGDSFAHVALDLIRGSCLPSGRDGVAHELPDVVLWVSDGGSDLKPEAQAAAADLQAMTDRIVAVSLGDSVNDNQQAELDGIAGAGGHVFKKIDFASVDDLVGDVLAAICNFARPMCCPPYYLFPNPGDQWCS